MSRLTNKFNRYGYVLNHKEDFTENSYQVIQKLGKLEDLEEQIGCPLDRLQETNEIYVLDMDGKLKKYQIIGLNFKEKRIYFWMDFCPMYLSFDEYKSVYWLKEDRSE